ncbi:MAG: L-serine ammonia-lyase, iron-sulfur-dependent, subunit alpha [Lachnospiraceae bacterium]|nr:L-serine ammonia-lyase, iron-sulfur-dependent, subunit alpha [Lachnospiraceae bacterium]
MKSLKELYRIGHGPSSSHTMGPAAAAKIILDKYPDADSYKVILYGSLAKTGRGHQTDVAIKKEFKDTEVTVIFDTEIPENELPHPNTLDFVIEKGAHIEVIRVMSIGGGAIRFLGDEVVDTPDVYPEKSFTEIAEYCKAKNIRLSDYVYEREGNEIKDYLYTVWETMKGTIAAGLQVSGTLPGGLNVERKAQYLLNQRHIDESEATRENRTVCAYAFAVAEPNADNGVIVTAPTCGACGVVPSALKYMQDKKGFSDAAMINALAVGGLIGNIIKSNASISGAECGWQAEVGAACSMCAAALAELHEMGIDQIEYAAEVAMEHHLGLTCDPICGLVQIPCIERNAVAAMRAINALSLANFLTNTRKISFDMVVETMRQTGLDLNLRYRETSEGGLANLYKM